MAKILLAEDDHAMRTFLCAALQKAGHDVVDCENGKDAWLQIHKNKDFDLLLTDIVMPGMDGIELSQKATKNIPSIKTMFITGFSAVSVGKDAKKDHTDHHTKIMSKPFHLKDLINEVETLLAE